MVEKPVNDQWPFGRVPVTVVMLSRNEEHNIAAVCENLRGWAERVLLVDSYSDDATIDLALKNGIEVLQRRFDGFGSQWNFAIKETNIKTPWTMKLDPDERLSDELKKNIEIAINQSLSEGFSITRRLWFLGEPLPVRHDLVRIWRTGLCEFTDVTVNEYPQVDGKLSYVAGDLEHHDSPNLDHWLSKQNAYSTAEAKLSFELGSLAASPIFFGSALERRMWLKKHFKYLPGRFFWLFMYNYILLGAWRAGKVGYIWARLRSDVMRLAEYKLFELEIRGQNGYSGRVGSFGIPDSRVRQCE